MEIITLEYWLNSQDHAAMATYVAALLTGIATLLAVAIAALLTYKYTRQESILKHETAVRVDHLKRDIEALEKTWELLAYMAAVRESDLTILRWEADKENKKNKTYYANFDLLSKFIRVEVPRVFYTEHAGLHLPSSIKTQVFNYTSQLMGLYIVSKDKELENNSIPLNNPKLIKFLKMADVQLNKSLREELDKRYNELYSSAN